MLCRADGRGCCCNAQVFLEAGKSQVVTFSMHARDLTLVGADGARGLATGSWHVRIGVGEGEISRAVCVL